MTGANFIGGKKTIMGLASLIIVRGADLFLHVKALAVKGYSSIC